MVHHLALALALVTAPAAAVQLDCQLSEGQLRLRAGDHTYVLGDDGQIQPLGLRPSIAGTDPSGKGIWMYPRKLQQAVVLRDTPRFKRALAVYDLTEGEPRYALELELEVRAGSPALFVTSRVRRLSPGTGVSYYFWGFTAPVTHYATPGAGLREFPNEWHVLAGSRWVFLKGAPGQPGYGVITDGRLGRSPASAEGVSAGETGAQPYLVCTPRTVPLARGESHDVSFGVFTAASASGVARVYRASGPAGPHRTLFDFRALATPPAPARPDGGGALSLATDDGLSLGLSGEGRITGLRVAGKSLAPRSVRVSGFLLRDWAARSPLQQATGTIRRSDRGARFSARCLDVALDATYTALGDRLDVRCDLKDLSIRDRAVTLYFALPVRADASWTWHDDLEHHRAIAPGEEYLSGAAESPIGANGRNSLYPFATLCGPRTAVALAIPMDQPRFCRMVYNSDLQCFFIAFDLALVPEVRRWPSSASVEFSVFTHDPAWGFRACAARYYAMFPRFFRKRVQREGGWVCWGNCADVPNIEELGYAYHWGVADARGVKWDNDHGLYSLPYVEATNMHQTMEEFASATSEQVVDRLRWVADPARTQPLPLWQYDHPYSPALGDRDAALRRSAAAYLNSLLYDAQGQIYGSATKTEFDLLIAKYIPCNANPALPGGLGAFFLDFWLPRVLASMESGGGRVDGIAQDNYHVGDTALSTRREHFPHESIPLCFETRTARPVIIKNFTTYEFTAEYLRRSPDHLVMANTCSAQFPFTYHLLDVHGYEWNIGNLAPFARVIAYHKPVCTLPVREEHKEERWIRWHVRYGFFPGGYANYQSMLNRQAMRRYVPIIRELSRAGWEPITLARSDDPDIAVERFGTGHFTLYNNSAAQKRVRLTLDRTLLRTPVGAARDLVSGARYTVERGAFEVSLPGREVVAVRLEP